jgi:hypothetical protein
MRTFTKVYNFVKDVSSHSISRQVFSSAEYGP